MANESNNEIQHRQVSDREANLAASATITSAKLAIKSAALLPLLHGDPLASLELSALSDFGGLLLENQKNRVAALCSKAIERVRRLSPTHQKRFEENLVTETGDRIFETAWRQAAEAVDPEKLDQISALLANSLSSESLREHHTRWLLKLLAEIDQVQIIVLQSLTKAHNNADFKAKHMAIFNDSQHPKSLPPFAQHTAQEMETYELARERHALHQRRIQRLAEL